MYLVVRAPVGTSFSVRHMGRRSNLFGSLLGRGMAGYEDVKDAERLRHNSAMRWIVGGKAVQGCPAERFVAFYNKRGTCEQWIKEGKGAIK